MLKTVRRRDATTVIFRSQKVKSQGQDIPVDERDVEIAHIAIISSRLLVWCVLVSVSVSFYRQASVSEV